MNHNIHHLTRGSLITIVVVIMCLFFTSIPLFAQTVTPEPTTTAATEPYTYTVQVGDSWTSLSRETGLSIRELQAANSRSVRASGFLLVGETLTIPVGGAAPTAASTPEATTTTTPRQTTTSAAAEPQTYVVGPGESWNSVAQQFGVTVAALQAANPRAIRPGQVLYRGEVLTIPGAGEPVPAATTGATPPATSSATPTMEAATPTETAVAEPVITETATLPAEETETAGAEPTVTTCPDTFGDYPEILSSLVAQEDGIQAVLDYLAECQVLAPQGSERTDWTGDGGDDLVVLLNNPLSDSATPETDLLIFNSTEDGNKLAFRARAAGEVRLLATDDVNEDGLPDVVWLDTTCGASTCFDTVNVRSWDGEAWRDWIDGNITMAYAEIKLDDIRDTAQGAELELRGGVYGSVGAGPQRARTEVWGSLDGQPYTLLEKVYDPSTCLIHKVQDANEALARYKEIGLQQAREMYTEAVTNRNLTKCWDREDELEELRSFSLFREALIYAYQGDRDKTVLSIEQLQDLYPDSLFALMGQSWLATLVSSGDIATACRAATAFAEANPAVYEGLSDYGYANPSYQAADLCPILEVGGTSVSSTEATATVALTPEAVEATKAPTEAAAGTATALPILGQEGELPDCPTNLNDYAAALPQVLSLADDDALVVETWLRVCDGMADDRGGMLLDDFNGDGIQDALFLPTIVSDLGFGPEGRQGAVLLFHGMEEGGHELVYAPEIFGQPTIISSGDVNGDGRIDLAWTIEGCSTFCVKEIQVVTWDPAEETYVSIVEPGATIAQGTARFEDLPENAPGQGKQLVLEGGVSGTTEGGLEVPHTETWQSVRGENFRRLAWTYDRDMAGSDCLGLRLIEADVALQAADVLGYATAVEAYQAGLDPTLTACSIYGVPADQELRLLQGLTSFRLIQAQALDGDQAAAQETLTALTAGQPDGEFTEAATEWLAAYEESGDARSACEAVQPIFDKNTLTWQITDHFGFNHPALAPEQVCFVPRAE